MKDKLIMKLIKILETKYDHYYMQYDHKTIEGRQNLQIAYGIRICIQELIKELKEGE